MNRYINKEYMQRILFVVVGSMIMGAGIGIAVASGLGADPLAILCDVELEYAKYIWGLPFYNGLESSGTCILLNHIRCDHLLPIL